MDEGVRSGYYPLLSIYFHGGLLAITTDILISDITCVSIELVAKKSAVSVYEFNIYLSTCVIIGLPKG